MSARFSPSLLVGIAGGTASGKSRFAAALAQALAEGRPPLSAQIIPSDHYFRNHDPAGPKVTLPSGEVYFDYNHPDAVDHARLAADLDRLRQEEGAPDVLIVEGLMILYTPIIRDRLDLRLFIELEDDERALRRLVRNLGSQDPIDLEKGRWIADYYCASARVGHRRYVEPSRVYADLIVRGDGDFERLARMVAAVVRDMYAQKQPGGESNG